MTKREQQIADMEAELRLPLTKARRRDVTAMLTIAKQLHRNARPADEYPSYRAAMIDAGRGRLLR